MTTMVNPWVLAGGLVALLMAFGIGYKHGKDVSEGETAIAERVAEKAAKAASKEAAKAIAKIKVTNTTIRQKVEKEVYEKPVYRDCVHSPDGLLLVNEAIVGPGDRQLPAADAPR